MELDKCEGPFASNDLLEIVIHSFEIELRSVAVHVRKPEGGVCTAFQRRQSLLGYEVFPLRAGTRLNYYESICGLIPALLRTSSI